MFALLCRLCIVLCLGLACRTALAEDTFSAGWTLDTGASALNFQSVKNTKTVEESRFATFSGMIDPAGKARISVLVDSIDTKIDLRNVRMRFLFFESFQYPEALIEAQLDDAALSDLGAKRRLIVDLPYTLTLHGVTKGYVTPVAVTLLSDDQVAVSSTSPVVIAAEDFGLLTGIEKLQEAANVTITPSASVTFDLIFTRNGSVTPAVIEAAPAKPADAALEVNGDFDTASCEGRFEILSRAGNIFFRSGSARLSPKSAPLLDSLAGIISRCPGLIIEVSGHTDSDGSDNANLALSEARAKAVAAYLGTHGVPAERLVVAGYGETRPIVPNDDAENKAKNRRIEFTVVRQ